MLSRSLVFLPVGRVKKFLNFCFAFTGKEINHRFAYRAGLEFRKQNCINTDIQFFGNQEYCFGFLVADSVLQVPNGADAHV